MMDVTSLYLLEGNDPTYRLIFAYSSGDAACQPDIHLPHFVDLCMRLRAAFPPVAAGISDTKLLVLLAAAMNAFDCLHTLEEAFVNLWLVQAIRGGGLGSPQRRQSGTRRAGIVRGCRRTWGRAKRACPGATTTTGLSV